MASKVLRIEKRTEGRLQMYRGELPEIILTIGDIQYFADACDLSSAGIGLIIHNERDWLTAWKSGLAVKLHFRYSDQVVPAVISRIGRTRFDGADVLRVGCVFEHRPRTMFLRERRRFSLHDSFRVAIVCPHPQLFGRYIQGQVLDISRSGLSFGTKADDTSILPPFATLDARLLLATAAELSVNLVVRHVQVRGDLRIYGCLIRDSAQQFSQQVAEQLLALDQAPTIRQLADEGFDVVNTEKALQFSYANAAEFSKVLSLRQMVYYGPDVDDTSALEAYRDQFDEQARQLIFSMGGQLVGCVRLQFPGGNLGASELAARKIDLPAYFRKQGLLEASFLVVHPDFDVADLLLNMLSKVCGIGMQKSLRFVAIACSEGHAARLQAIGAIKVAAFEMKLGDSREISQRVILIDGHRYLSLKAALSDRLRHPSRATLLSAGGAFNLQPLHHMDRLRLYWHHFLRR